MSTRVMLFKAMHALVHVTCGIKPQEPGHLRGMWGGSSHTSDPPANHLAIRF